MKQFHFFVLSMMLLMSVLPGCGTNTSRENSVLDTAEPFSGATNPAPLETSQISPPEPVQVHITASIPSEPAEKARQDLAHRLGISPDDISVVTVIGQEFSTEAFNCRTTKERIAKEESPQVISGFTILLNVSGSRYEYHVSDQAVIYCRPLP